MPSQLACILECYAPITCTYGTEQVKKTNSKYRWCVLMHECMGVRDNTGRRERITADICDKED